MTDKRRLILDAALECFLDYGFRKTSLEDVASAAGISRSSIYGYFRNKDDLFLSTVERLVGGAHDRAGAVLGSDLEPREKLLAIVRAWVLEPMGRILASRHGAELMEAGHGISSDMVCGYEKRMTDLLAGVVGDAGLAELMVLSIHGLKSDSPDIDVLEERLTRLVDLVLAKGVGQAGKESGK